MVQAAPRVGGAHDGTIRPALTASAGWAMHPRLLRAGARVTDETVVVDWQRFAKGALIGSICALAIGCGDDAPATSAIDLTASTSGAGTSGSARDDGTTADPPIPGSDSTAVGPDPDASSSSDTTSFESSTTIDEVVDDDETTDGAEPPVVELSFTEVAAQAGLDYDHGEFNTSPNCIIDQVGPGFGGYCISERMTGAVSVTDLDDDGDYDLYASRLHGPDRLYENQGDGTFVDIAAEAGVAFAGASSGTAWADLDNDGDQDLYVTALGDLRHYLFINDGTGHFTEQAIARGASLKSDYQPSPTGVAIGDYDLDGYLDLYVAEWKTNAGLGKQPSHSRLLHNLGASAPGHFEDVTESAGVLIDHVWSLVQSQAGTFAFSPAFADLDGDRWPDLTIVSDFDCSRLFWNNGDGTFTDATVASGVGIDHNGMGSTFGDYDLDGDLDWFVTAITSPDGPPHNRLYRYIGDRNFLEVAAVSGVGYGGWGWGTTFFDPDNDGDQDLVMGAGYYYTTYQGDENRLWRNKGDGSFEPDQADTAGIGLATQVRGMVAFDYDGDGDQDLMAINNATEPSLFRNDTGSLHDFLRVRVVGTASNRDGIGAKVSVRVTPNSPVQVQEIGSASHYIGQAPKPAHFGAGFGNQAIHEVRVYWPMTDQEQVFADVPRNSELMVVEP
jgi:hypothetical protein